MMNIKIYVTSAFCKDGAGGNKAGIVFDHPELNREDKMRIARELGFSESVFITGSTVADYMLEYFTPTEEVPLCGHATIAAFSTMYQCEKAEIEDQTYSIETAAGLLKVSVSKDGLVMMEQNRPVYYEQVERSELLPCLGEGVNDKMESRIVSTGLKDIMVPFSSVEALHQAKPDFERIAELSKAKDVVGIHAFAISNRPICTCKVEEHQEKKSHREVTVDAICRNFAPLYGIDEESATGTSSCALASYLHKNGYKKDQYVFEQGYALDCPSRIYVRVHEKDGEIDQVYVGGYGKILSTQLFIL